METSTLDTLREKAAALAGLSVDSIDPDGPVEDLPLSNDQWTEVTEYGAEVIGSYTTKEWLAIWFASRRLPKTDPTFFSLRLLAPLWPRAQKQLERSNWRELHPSLRDVSVMIDSGKAVFSSNEGELAYPPFTRTKVLSVLLIVIPVSMVCVLIALSIFEGRDLTDSAVLARKSVVVLMLFYPLLFVRGIVATLRGGVE